MFLSQQKYVFDFEVHVMSFGSLNLSSASASLAMFFFFFTVPTVLFLQSRSLMIWSMKHKCIACC